MLWCLPAHGGEAYAFARRQGGWTGLQTAVAAPTVLVSADAQVGSTDEDDHERRARTRS